MASAIFKQILVETGVGPDWRVESAGTWATEGVSISSGSFEAMREQGEDLSDHKARNVTRQLLEKFNLVLTMERGHKEALRAEFPELASRIYLLSEMAGYSHDIRDPIGGSFADYRETREELTRLLEQGFEKINALAQAGTNAD